MREVITVTVEPHHKEYLEKRRKQRKVAVSASVQQAIEKLMKSEPNEENGN